MILHFYNVLIFLCFLFIYIFPQKPLKVTQKDGKIQVEGYDDIEIGNDGKLNVNSYSITLRRKNKKKNDIVNEESQDFFLDDNFLNSDDIIPRNQFALTDPLGQGSSKTNDFPLFSLNNPFDSISVKTNITTNTIKTIDASYTNVITNIIFVTNTVTNYVDSALTNDKKQQKTTMKDKKKEDSLSEDEVISLILKAGKLKKKKRYDELVDLLNYIDKRGGEDYSLRYRIKLMQGTIYYQLKLYDQAKKKWQESLKLKPNQPKLQAALKRMFVIKK